MVQCNAKKKRRGLIDRAEDSTIGGEWRNASAVPKEEDGWSANRRKHSILRCTMQAAYLREETKGCKFAIGGR